LPVKLNEREKSVVVLVSCSELRCIVYDLYYEG
jgi:hypothetical protein